MIFSELAFIYNNMSKQVIKLFFDHQKELKTRKPICVLKPEIVEEELPVINFSDIDDTLNKGIFMYDYDLYYYLDSLTADEYQYIMNNIQNYSDEIQQTLKPKFTPLITEEIAKRINYKLVDLTDEKIEEHRLKKAIHLEEEVHKATQNYVPPLRPSGKIDNELIEKTKLLELENKRLGEALNQKVASKTYIPPALRNQNNPKVLEIKEIIQNIENEIYSIREKIDKEDELWKQRCKDDYRQQCRIKQMSVVQEEIFSFTEV